MRFSQYSIVLVLTLNQCGVMFSLSQPKTGNVKMLKLIAIAVAVSALAVSAQAGPYRTCTTSCFGNTCTTHCY